MVKKEIEAVRLLKTYQGINPYLLKLKREVFENGKSSLVEGFVAEYILKNYATTPRIISKTVKIADWYGAKLQQEHSIGFLPEKILITWQEAYAKNYYRFDDILADISAEVANKLGFHPYVDLGLPSGTKWAKMNIGAEKETDSGLYFAWGETQGYSGNIEGRWFDWYTYKYGMQSSLTKYNSTDSLTVLEPSDDAATVNWGGKWHMPTAEQIEELRDRHNCSGVWVTDYNKSGVNGILFTSERNGNQLFIPAVSNCISSLCTGKIGEFGYIWSSTLQTDDDKYAGRSLRISSCGIDKSCNLRCVGIPVRPVFE